MRVLGGLHNILTGIVFVVVASAGASFAETRPDSSNPALTGRIASAPEGAMDGVLARAKHDKTNGKPKKRPAARG